MGIKNLCIAFLEPEIVWRSVRIVELLLQAATVPTEIQWSEYIWVDVLSLPHYPNQRGYVCIMRMYYLLKMGFYLG